MEQLTQKKCVPCSGSVSALHGEELKKFFESLVGGWKLVEEHHIEKEFKFKDFKAALAFTNKVGELAESEGHHPDIFLSWGKVVVRTWTHKALGLTENDFILAAKIDEL